MASTDTNAALRGFPDTFQRLGVPPVINACGIYTDLGGSILSPTVWAAMSDLNTAFVDIVSLLERTGERVATLLGCEAARITPGASAAIALSVAACIVSRNALLGETLPNTAGLKGQIVLQRKQAVDYKYLLAVRMPGAEVVLAGDDAATRADDLRRAIGARTGAVFVPAHLDSLEGCLSLETIVDVAKPLGVPVVVDAAYMNFPPSHMGSYTRRGADLTCFSAKYFDGPNAGGFVCGRQDLIEAIRGLDFTRHESGAYRRFGRAFKMGRYEIAAVLLALEEWFAADHDKRLERHAVRARRIEKLLGRSNKVSVELKCFTLDEQLIAGPVNAVVVSPSAACSLNSKMLLRQLALQVPSIRAIELNDSAVFVTETLQEGQDELIALRILDAVG